MASAAEYDGPTWRQVARRRLFGAKAKFSRAKEVRGGKRPSAVGNLDRRHAGGLWQLDCRFRKGLGAPARRQPSGPSSSRPLRRSRRRVRVSGSLRGIAKDRVRRPALRLAGGERGNAIWAIAEGPSGPLARPCKGEETGLSRESGFPCGTAHPARRRQASQCEGRRPFGSLGFSTVGLVDGRLDAEHSRGLFRKGFRANPSGLSRFSSEGVGLARSGA